MISLTETLTDVRPRARRGRLGRPTAASPPPTRATSSAAAAASRSSTPTAPCSSTAATLLEQLAVRFGHYPERRSDAKGTEPEAIAYATLRPQRRALRRLRAGQLRRRVPSSTADGLARVLAVAAGAARPRGAARRSRTATCSSRRARPTTPPFGVRSTVMIYELKPGQPTYPQIYLRQRRRRRADPVVGAVGADRDPRRARQAAGGVGRLLRREQDLHHRRRRGRRPTIERRAARSPGPAARRQLRSRGPRLRPGRLAVGGQRRQRSPTAAPTG